MTYQVLLREGLVLRANFDLGISVPNDAGKITEDSREARAGSVFFAMKGEKCDGHDFIMTLSGKKCTVIAEHIPPEYRGNYMLVGNVRKANAVFWSAFYREPQNALTMIAVTGTNGKTTVCHMLQQILRRAGKSVAVIGTMGGEIGDEVIPLANTTPAPRVFYALLRKAADQGIRYAVFEASSMGLLYEKLSPVVCDIALYTGLSEEHLDNHGSMAAYAAAKAKLFAACDLALLNGDDGHCETMRTAAGSRTKCCLCSEKSRFADFMADHIEDEGLDGVSFDLIGENEAMHIRCPAPGAFNVMNAMLAASAARLLGIGCEEITLALRQYEAVSGRMEEVFLRDADFRCYVDYAHTPDALRQVLRTLRDAIGTSGKLTVCFGCGGGRDREKRPLMGAIAAQYADRVILTGDNDRGEDKNAILREIAAGIKGEDAARIEWSVIPDRAEACRAALALQRAGDILLVAGKGHEDYTLTNDREEKEKTKTDAALLASCWKERRQ